MKTTGGDKEKARLASDQETDGMSWSQFWDKFCANGYAVCLNVRCPAAKDMEEMEQNELNLMALIRSITPDMYSEIFDVFTSRDVFGKLGEIFTYLEVPFHQAERVKELETTLCKCQVGDHKFWAENWFEGILKLNHTKNEQLINQWDLTIFGKSDAKHDDKGITEMSEEKVVMLRTPRTPRCYYDIMRSISDEYDVEFKAVPPLPGCKNGCKTLLRPDVHKALLQQNPDLFYWARTGYSIVAAGVEDKFRMMVDSLPRKHHVRLDYVLDRMVVVQKKRHGTHL